MTSNEKRLLTATGTVLAILTISSLVLIPYVRKWQSYDSISAERLARIKTLKRQIVNKPMLAKEIASMNHLIDTSKLFMRAENKQIADANLLSTVKKLIEKSGANISSVNIINRPRGQQPTNVSTVKIIFIITNKGMVEILKNLADAKPLMNITIARITPLMGRQGWGHTKDTGKARVDLTIEAFFAAGGNL